MEGAVMREEGLVVHYLDDDVEDLEAFKDAVHYTQEKITLHTYTRADVLLKSISEKQSSNTLVLVDLNMPGKNGFEVLKEIRETDALKMLPVLIISTSKNQTAINITRDLGANLYIVKPGSFNDLRHIVQTISTINWQDNKGPHENYLFNMPS